MCLQCIFIDLVRHTCDRNMFVKKLCNAMRCNVILFFITLKAVAATVACIQQQRRERTKADYAMYTVIPSLYALSLDCVDIVDRVLMF